MPALLALCVALPALADPLNSVMWESLHSTVLKGEPVLFDESVKVNLPASVEDGQHVPVWVDASAVKDARELMVLADYNPIPHALTLELQQALPKLAVSIRVNQGTPVRAAVKDGKGVWHVAGRWLDAPGGGCALPTPTRSTTDWAHLLGKLSGRTWRESDGTLRLRFMIMHPMDTGFVDKLPRFNLERVVLADAQGQPLARIQMEASVSENPLLTLFFAQPAPGPWKVQAKDSDGNQYQSLIPVAMQEAIQ
jgi:sulfur-oxidizing protein SoxY